MHRAILIAALVLPAPLWAQATPERAAEIQSTLQRYLPPVPGALTVAPEGAGYTVTLDFAPYIAMMPQGLANLSATSIVMNLTEAAGGLYQVSYDQSFHVHFEVPGQVLIDIGADTAKGGGTFDPVLGIFTQSTADYTGLTIKEDINDYQGRTLIDYTIASISSTSTGAANPAGGGDVQMTFQASGISEQVSMPMGPGQPSMSFGLKAASYSGTGAVTGLRMADIYGLIAWAFAHPDPQMLLGAQGEARAALKAALPIFASLEVTGGMQGVEVTTPVGPITASAGSATISANGVVTDGRFAEAITLSNVTPPPGILPPWAGPLVPKDLSISFDVSGFDLLTPATHFLDQVDWAQGPSPADEAQMMQMLMPQGTLKIGFGFHIGAGATYDGEGTVTMNVGPASMPTGQGTVRLSGIDAILSNLQSAPPEIAQGAGGAIGMARGLGRQDGDATVWDIEMTPDGKLLVNGNDLSPMLGMQ